MKRGMAGRTRKGAPPLPRQRIALRVVQLTLLAVASFLSRLSLMAYRDPNATTGEFIGPAAIAAVLVVGVAWMGLRAVRGPQPPDLDR